MSSQVAFKNIKEIPPVDYYTSGRRTCAGCGPALGYRIISKAAGPNTIFIGPTGCMYVANAHQFLTSPYAVPWHHTQLGGGGAAAIGVASALRTLMLKGKRKLEDINVVVMGGDGAMADIGFSGLSMGLSYDYQRLLYIIYDNEAYMNTGVQASSTTPWGATTTFTPAGKVKPIGNTRLKKNMALVAAAHPKVKYVATATLWPPLDLMNKVHRALNAGGPTLIHVLLPCPKGWFTNPSETVDLSRLAVETGMWVLWESIEGQFKLNYRPKPRKHVREYLAPQGRFSHLKDEDMEKIDKMIEEEWKFWEESAKLGRLVVPY
jgi:pyruvate ferredoxin oxidoreductase beta subunit/oxalate oxidoreductase subunit beta|uniref:2-oxoacid oxidoreductase (ferredoxin) n=1 Tax=Fervidicoccus fontis TaxID=683846 RepID=A0A7J3SM72_9CREN